MAVMTNRPKIEKFKQALLRDFAKSPSRVAFHEQDLSTASLAPDYRQAVIEALVEWKALREHK